jgi:hypothetical protein
MIVRSDSDGVPKAKSWRWNNQRVTATIPPFLDIPRQASKALAGCVRLQQHFSRTFACRSPYPPKLIGNNYVLSMEDAGSLPTAKPPALSPDPLIGKAARRKVDRSSFRGQTQTTR